jgi:hypothetical protein
MAKVSIKGVLIGGVSDIIVTYVLTFPFLLFVMIRFDLHKNLPPGTLAATIRSHWALLAVQLLIGCFSSAVGGYVAAWLAKHDELLNGLLSSYLCLSIGLYSIFAGKGSDPLPVYLLALIVSPACSLLGGYIRRSQQLGSRRPA